MSEISINTVENIDEIDQIILLTTCTTKLHRYYRVTLHFLDFQQKNSPEIPPPPFITFVRVYNIITKKVLPENLCREFLEVEEEGKRLYDKFVQERIVGETSIWDPITERKLPTFRSNLKIVQMKVQNQLINIRAERKLMSRFLIATRARPDIDLPGYLGKYEFSAVPRSLFTSEGDLLPCGDKAKITAEMIKCLQPEDIINDNPEEAVTYRVILIDGMAVANKINIKKMKLESWSAFAFEYIENIKRESQGYQEVQVIFDRYIESSLKADTR